MTLRADHVAGLVFVVIGALVLALSGDLPFGNLSMPGSGFLPRLTAFALIGFGLVLALRAGESEPFSAVSWSDGKHAGLVIAIAAAGVALYTTLGFIITMAAMMIALLIVIERRNPLRAALYSLTVVLCTYAIFAYVLKTPLITGPLGF